MSRTSNMKALHAQLNKLGLMDEKRDIIGGFTNGRTDSARQLTDTELSGIVTHLNGYRPDPDSPRQRMVRSLYFHARQLGWYAPDGRGGVKVDVPRLEAWCIKYTTAHRSFKKMNPKQLAQAVTAIKQYVTTNTEKQKVTHVEK